MERRGFLKMIGLGAGAAVAAPAVAKAVEKLPDPKPAIPSGQIRLSRRTAETCLTCTTEYEFGDATCMGLPTVAPLRAPEMRLTAERLLAGKSKI